MEKKIAIVVSHPIQHFCPQYASLAALGSVKIKVFFASALGYKRYVDPNFKQEIAWDNLRLNEFEHVFLNGDDKVLPADKDIDAGGLEEALAAFQPALVVVYGYFQKLQRRAYRWSLANGIPMAYISDSERVQKRSFLKELIKYPYVRKYFSGIDYFLSVGNENEKYYAHYKVPEQKLVRMHFSIDIRSYEQAYPRRAELSRELRTRFGLSGQDHVLSVVGKLVNWKNQGDIIDAMKVLEQQGVVLHLFIIGSGEDQRSLEEKAGTLGKSKVYFPGFVKPEELPAYYAASDIYIHPASVEPHSLAISEAIYMGCPVIISDRCGSYGENDDVQKGRNGFVYPCGDISSLAQMITGLIGDDMKRSQFSVYSHTLGEQFQRRSHGGFIQELLQKLN